MYISEVTAQKQKTGEMFVTKIQADCCVTISNSPPCWYSTCGVNVGVEKRMYFFQPSKPSDKKRPYKCKHGLHYQNKRHLSNTFNTWLPLLKLLSLVRTFPPWHSVGGGTRDKWHEESDKECHTRTALSRLWNIISNPNISTFLII